MGGKKQKRLLNLDYSSDINPHKESIVLVKLLLFLLEPKWLTPQSSFSDKKVTPFGGMSLLKRFIDQLGFDIGFDKLWCHQLNRMTLLLKFTSPMMCASASFHTN